ncbi:helix-turn-helix domain-containing protein [Microbulbifer rhizosphaerae]|uniref:AraC-like DNA-binding protein n=1 Tax=Microbulbifer rhizosphaerae TaxID=1562603 RepID=A0A7W4WAC3_9GAMM|nr:AraC family transcriptional regulator [Microbulbifer rhizosphaerae]MBB3060560.1 AraC-like DNA-binding protein [Microbulbifer rhizosphaerae]
MAALSLSMMTLGIIGFSLHLLLIKVKTAPYLAPLIVALLSLAAISSGALVFSAIPSLTYYYIAAIPPTFFILAPSLWLYSQALTSHLPWHFRQKYFIHYLPGFFALIVTVLILLLPDQAKHAIFFSNKEVDPGYTLFVVVSLFVAVVLWLTQSSVYLYKIVRCIILYNKQLNQVFAENKSKTLTWLNFLTYLIALAWIWSVLALLSDDSRAPFLLNEEIGMMLTLLVAWVLAYHGLQQQPGFMKLYNNISEPLNVVIQEESKNKYQRSALGDEQSRRIANKLKQALYEEQLYLDPDLTLYKLANHLGVSANYLSQTLNQTINMSFFEYVNAARIEAAKTKLLNKEDSVLNIAMGVGFNARSSFYKAFKACTGVTPSEFQKVNSAKAGQL